MAVKTITIDMEAYDILAGEKKEKESFSRLIKRRLRPRHTGENLIKRLQEICLSVETMSHVESLVKDRRKSKAKSPSL